MNKKIKAEHPLQWIFEPLQSEADFLQRKMFGCGAAYLGSRLMFVIAASEEPWNGLLVCTSREHHDVLLREFPALSPHKVLGKWLYLSQEHRDFEELAQALVKRARRRDPLLGIEPKPKKKSKKKGR